MSFVSFASFVQGMLVMYDKFISQKVLAAINSSSASLKFDSQSAQLLPATLSST